jgi:hypothetical protein
MLGVATDDALVRACEQRLGRVVQGAATCDLRRLAVPGATMKPRKPKKIVIALTADYVWLLDIRDWAVWFSVGQVLAHLPRRGLAAQWRRRWWVWPTVWNAELSWPELSTYLEGALMNNGDTERLIGLMTMDELAQELSRPAPATG